MVYKRSSMRYAHTTGHTNLIYTHDGENIVTCGTDGDIRRWSGIDDDDPTSNCLGEFVYCIAHTDNRLLASTDRNTLQAYTFPNMDNDGTLMRFTAPVTCLCVSGIYTAAGSEDMHIKVIKQPVDGEKDELEFEAHKAPVLSLDVCASKELLASVGGDGQLKIWNLQNGTEMHNIPGLEKTNSFESATFFGTPKFEPRNANSLAYAKDNEIFVLNTSNWEIQFTLNDENITGKYTCCAFSNDGQYLAAGTSKGEISIFDFMRKQTLKCESPSSECQSITNIVWNPKNNEELAYCDATGQLGTVFSDGKTASSDVDNLLSAEAEVAEDGFDDIDFQDDHASENANELNGDNGSFAGDDDDDDAISIERLKRKVMQSVDNFSNAADSETKDSMSRSEKASIDIAKLMPKTFPRQVAFQPSATPTSLEHRYLVWNSIGIVMAHADSVDGSIDVEFHDASMHHALHIPNYSQHEMASLSSTVLALSAQGVGKVVCIALEASGNKEWCIQLSDLESVEAIAATNKLVAVATNTYFLRLFTVMGTQREMISIPGPVVAMTGYENQIFVVYHCAPCSEDQQYLAAMLIRTIGFSFRTQHIPLSLPPGRQLRWLGFSDAGSPLFSDSMGLLQLFCVKNSCWLPVCDTLKHCQSISNNYFIISASEKNQTVQAVLCRASTYPMTNPRPMMQELPMQLPFCDLDTEKSELEDKLTRASIMSVTNSEKIIKETAIKLFALACRGEVEMRAKELIETIACPDLLLLAVKYASKLGRIHLSDRLSELMPQIEEEHAEREKQEQELQTNALSAQLLGVLNPNLLNGVNNVRTVNKLAPKSIDGLKRSSLKRSSLLNSPSLKKSNKESSTSEATTSILTPDVFSADSTQENMYESKTNKDSTCNSEELATRSPLNTVNPFAAKRKITDTDSNDILGSNKLKLMKK